MSSSEPTREVTSTDIANAKARGALWTPNVVTRAASWPSMKCATVGSWYTLDHAAIKDSVLR